MRVRGGKILASLLLPACATVQPSATDTTPVPSAPLATETHPTDVVADSVTHASSGAAQDAERPHPLLDAREPDPAQALPELSYRHLGMHIGGESNSSESKKPWLAAIDAGADGLLRCYRHVENPEAGGSYGVDLYVGLEGGAPEVRGSRQKIGGEQFDVCMKQAFGSLRFDRPERATVLSYSILFELR